MKSENLYSIIPTDVYASSRQRHTTVRTKERHTEKNYFQRWHCYSKEINISLIFASFQSFVLS